LHGWFLTLEGVEGAGKTTQAARLEQALSARGFDVLLTREPGGTALGEAIRPLVLGGRHEPTAEAELFLMLADRAQHVAEVILPALEAGRIVIGDRFSDATRAYQGGGRGLDRDFIESALAAATGGIEPDLTFLLDIPPDRARERLVQRAGLDRLEQEAGGFHARVREAYRRQVALAPDRIMIIDATVDADTVHETILSQALAAIGGDRRRQRAAPPFRP
jgi:dTMP kinase